MVVGFTTTYAINAYHHWWFFPGPLVSSTYKPDRHDNIVESGVKHHQTNKQTENNVLSRLHNNKINPLLKVFLNRSLQDAIFPECILLIYL
jgi:hypothetical protein